MTPNRSKMSEMCFFQVSWGLMALTSRRSLSAYGSGGAAGSSRFRGSRFYCLGVKGLGFRGEGGSQP